MDEENAEVITTDKPPEKEEEDVTCHAIDKPPEKEPEVEKTEMDFEDIAKNVLGPIMQKVDEMAFDCISSYKGDSDTPTHHPFYVKDGVLKKLNEVITYLEDRESYYRNASLIAFALKKDGDKPARKYKGMLSVAKAIWGLIVARQEQIQAEIDSAQKDQNYDEIARKLGFD